MMHLFNLSLVLKMCDTVGFTRFRFYYHLLIHNNSKNSSLVNPACFMIANNVPFAISL